jgi:hypothetical protein
MKAASIERAFNPVFQLDPRMKLQLVECFGLDSAW